MDIGDISKLCIKVILSNMQIVIERTNLATVDYETMTHYNILRCVSFDFFFKKMHQKKTEIHNPFFISEKITNELT